MGVLNNFFFNGKDKELMGSPSMVLFQLIKKKYSSLKLANNYLRKNWSFILDSMWYCQLIGIPIESESNSFMANLFLYYYE